MQPSVLTTTRSRDQDRHDAEHNTEPCQRDPAQQIRRHPNDAPPPDGEHKRFGLCGETANLEFVVTRLIDGDLTDGSADVAIHTDASVTCSTYRGGNFDAIGINQRYL